MYFDPAGKKIKGPGGGKKSKVVQLYTPLFRSAISLKLILHFQKMAKKYILFPPTLPSLKCSQILPRNDKTCRLHQRLVLEL